MILADTETMGCTVGCQKDGRIMPVDHLVGIHARRSGETVARHISGRPRSLDKSVVIHAD